MTVRRTHPTFFWE